MSTNTEEKEPNSCPKIPLLFHLDINGVCYLGDSTEKHETIEDFVSETMARNCFGLIQNSTEWVPLQNEDPFMTELPNRSNLKSEISYYDFCKMMDHKQYKKKAHEFFAMVLANQSQQFENLKSQMNRLYECMYDDYSGWNSENNLIEAAVYLITKYPQAGIVLRTFGYDGPETVRELQNQMTNMKPFVHAFIRNGNLIEKKSHEADDWLNLSHDEYKQMLNSVQDSSQSPRIKPMDWILDQHHNGRNILIHEDYHEWKENPSIAGKVIEPSERAHQFGFDDNDCMYVNQQSATELKTFAKFFRVNTVLASTDSKYYTRLLESFIVKKALNLD